MPKPILIDSGFLYALADRSDKHHLRAIEFARTNTNPRLVPNIVLTEVTHVIRERLGHHVMQAFVAAFPGTKHTQLIPISMADVARAAQIMAAYPKPRLDFVDCCIVALAERTDVLSICTFDRN